MHSVPAFLTLLTIKPVKYRIKPAHAQIHATSSFYTKKHQILQAAHRLDLHICLHLFIIFIQKHLAIGHTIRKIIAAEGCCNILSC